MASPTPQYTDFSKDVIGRYVCNSLDEALASISGGRLFDIIVVGGGAFGGALTQHAMFQDRFKNHRILVLDAGPQLATEHVQNLPSLGLFPPPPATTDPGVPRAEVWGLPWESTVPMGFPGLAYCLGGRSLFWGGWSPRLIAAETPASVWPAQVLSDLRNPPGKSYYDQASEQLGVTQTNDFIFDSPDPGELHPALRQQLYEGIKAGKVPGVVPFSEQALHLTSPPAGVPTDELKLEAPLAVQGNPPRSGFFPINKFSSMPLLMVAARQAEMEVLGNGGDPHKRVMVVPNCHVTGLETVVDQGVGKVVAVHVGGGARIPVPDRGVVVVAAGTIESTRLALLSFQGILGYDLIGTNLVSHMRSNYTFRVPRAALVHLNPTDTNLQASALFVKGRKVHADGSTSHFHLQITAGGTQGPGTNSDAELMVKIPDMDTIDRFQNIPEDTVVVTIRSVGELQATNPANRVSLTAHGDEFGVPRATVALGNPRDPAQAGETPQTTNDRETWDAMDQMATAVRDVIAGAAGFTDVPRGRVRDGLGTTHHEGGTLRMGVDPAASVTTPNGRFHHVVNAYAIGPSLLPNLGSPNPMLSGVALARRLADHLVSPLPPPALEPGFQWLFDGTQASLAGWQQAGPGRMRFDAAEQVIVAEPGNDIGLSWYSLKAFGDFVLRLQFRLDSLTDNSGVFVRFLDPRKPLPPPGDPRTATNPAWGPVHTGFEIQIDETAAPDGADKHRTGAVYAVEVGNAAGQQVYARGSAMQPGEWNDYEISVQGGTYTVRLNDHTTSVFTNTDATRGQPPGYIGLQQHTGAVAFRAVRIK